MTAADAAQSRDRTACLAVEDLVHRYGEREALAGVSLTVAAGEIFGFLGPNGSGKSTLFKILSTLLAPTSGTASVLGTDVARDPDMVRAMIGVAFQSPSLDMKLSCIENLVHRGHLYGMSGSALRSRSADLLDRGGLTGRHGDKVENLSGGQRRRVEIAAALLHGPRVLLLDEPATGLDPGARQEMWSHLVRLRDEEGVTVAMTTHLMEEADRCDRLAILDRGRLVAYGTPDELRAEVGGDVIDVTTADPPALAREMTERLSVETKVVDGSVRVERPDGYRFLSTVMDAFGDRIESVRVGKPTLADVFLHQTGRLFAEDQLENADEPAPASGRRKRRRA